MSPTPRCSRPIYIVSAVFLGSLGVHNFIAGRKKPAMIQLGMGTIGWVLLIPPFLSALWALYEAITVTEDGAGVPFQSVNLTEAYEQAEARRPEAVKAA
ncbi:MAG: NINE protein [Phycisphaerales bacterium JB059]